MSDQLTRRIFDELEQLVLIDPHTHINPHAAASTTLADIMGYHYYTELAHSAGLPREQIEEPGIGPKEKVARLVPKLADLDNTIQVTWLMEMCREFFGFDDERITSDNWESLYDTAEQKMAQPDWEEQVLSHSRLEKVFLTNDFDDPLEGFDTSRYIPCLRTDDLVFKLHEPAVRQRLAKATGIEVGDAHTLRNAIGKLFEHFVNKGAKACAISLPPDFRPTKVDRELAEMSIKYTCQDASERLTEGNYMIVDQTHAALVNSQFVFWTLAEMCAEHNLPFDLMIGVNRGVYASGVYQGQDLYNRQTSLHQYAGLFNAFPDVTFPISVLDHTANPGAGQLRVDLPQRRDERPLVVLEHPDVHRDRHPQPAGGGPRVEADRLLQRHVQAGVRPPQVPHVPPRAGQGAGRVISCRTAAGARHGPSCSDSACCGGTSSEYSGLERTHGAPLCPVLRAPYSPLSVRTTFLSDASATASQPDDKGAAFWADASLFSVAVIWGVNIPLMKIGLEQVDVFVFNAVRLVISAASLVAFAAWEWRRGRALPGISLRELLVYAAMGTALYQVLFLLGMDYTTSGNTALIIATVPMWTALLAHVFLEERLRRLAWFGLGLALVGTVIVALQKGDVTARREHLLGNMMVLAAALLWAGSTVYSRPLLRSISPLQLAARAGVVSLPVHLLLAAGRYEQNLPALRSPELWMILLYSGVLSSGLSQPMWHLGVRFAGAAHAAVIQNLIPVVAIVAAWVTRGEVATPAQLLGGALILGGLVTMRMARILPTLARVGSPRPVAATVPRESAGAGEAPVAGPANELCSQSCGRRQHG